MTGDCKKGASTVKFQIRHAEDCAVQVRAYIGDMKIVKNEGFARLGCFDGY